MIKACSRAYRWNEDGLDGLTDKEQRLCFSLALWNACWDLAYQAIALSLIDNDIAKQQLELLLNERYIHPNGYLTVYEWDFKDTNPPVHAAAALSVFRTERERNGTADLNFLQRMLNKLLLKPLIAVYDGFPANRAIG